MNGRERDADAAEAAAPPAAGPARPRRQRLRRWAVRIAVLAALGLGAAALPRLLYWLEHESTDDAYVYCGTIVPVLPQVSGRVTAVYVTENQDVHRGDPILQIDDADYAARLRQAEAELSRLKATSDQARILLRRTRALAKTQVLARESLDEIEARAREAEAAVVAARAQRDLARIDLGRTRIVAPVSGRVAGKNVSVGQVVAPGDSLLALVDLDDLWIRANFKETQIGDMKVGQPVDVEVDTYPGLVLRGHVESFQPGTGAVFSLLPPENATGNFVKVVQRVPVRIAIDSPPDPARPLYPGLSVTPYVSTRVAPRAASPGRASER